MKVLDILCETPQMWAFVSELIEKYPLINIAGLSNSLITDIPKNITQQQLEQLIVASFSPAEIKEILRYNGTLQDAVRSYDTQSAHSRSFVDNVTTYEEPYEEFCCDWKTFVQHTREMLDSGDFEP